MSNFKAVPGRISCQLSNEIVCFYESVGMNISTDYETVDSYFYKL